MRSGGGACAAGPARSVQTMTRRTAEIRRMKSSGLIVTQGSGSEAFQISELRLQASDLLLFGTKASITTESEPTALAPVHSTVVTICSGTVAPIYAASISAI